MKPFGNTCRRTYLQESFNDLMLLLIVPILFVGKKDGYCRLCIVYRALNRLVIANKYPFPRISELRDKTRVGKWFTRLEMKNTYKLVGIVAGHKWNTAFHAKKRLFEYTEMPFGLTIMPGLFQELMYTIFKDM